MMWLGLLAALTVALPLGVLALSRWLSGRVCLVQYDPAARAATVTAVVVQPVQSPRELPASPAAASMRPRIIRGEIER